MNKKIKNFVRRNKTTIIAVTATAVPLIVLNVKFFQANRAWAARNGCHDHTDHVNFSDKSMDEFVTGAKRVFFNERDKSGKKDLVVMSANEYERGFGK